MGAILSLIGGSKTIVYILAGVAIFAVVSGLFLRDRARDLQLQQLTANNALQSSQLDDAQRVNQASQRAVDELRAETARQQAIAAQERLARSASDARLALVTKGIRNAKPGDDAALAPVLRDALSGLRGGSASAAPAR